MAGVRFRAIAANLLAAAALSACAGHEPQPQLGVSPRVECASFTALLDFEPDSADLLPAATPILRDVTERIQGCRAVGGELTRIAITAFPDRAGGRQESRWEIDARARTAREGLIAAGAPRSAIRIRRHADADNQLMQRRAEISIEMW
jgi:hypothetical protein